MRSNEPRSDRQRRASWTLIRQRRRLRFVWSRCSPSFRLSLIYHRFLRGPHGLGISKIVVFDRLRILVQFINKRNSGGDVVLDNIGVRDRVEIFYKGAKTVSVSCDQDTLARRDLRHYLRLEIWDDALDSLPERLALWKFSSFDRRVTWVFPVPTRIGFLQQAGRNIVAAPPDQDLFLAILRRRLGLVQPFQRAVVSLVQQPRFRLRYPHQVHLIKHDPESADRSFQDGRVSFVKNETF